MKREVVLIFSLIMLSLLIGEALAITGSIGNSRMILRLETGEQIEKYVLVRNVNDVPVDISISVSGDLEKYVELKEEGFTLDAGKEKKAYFTIVSPEAGSTETKINVAFTPEEGHGVGLSSTVVVIAEGESQGTSILNWLSGGDEEEEENEEEEQETGPTGAFGGIDATSAGLLITTVALVIFILLLVMYSQKINKKKRLNKSKKSVKKSE